MTSDVGPVENLAVGGDAALPFVCRHENGTGDAGRLVKARAIQCALSRICGVCGTTLGRPVAFVGGPDEVAAGSFAFPPTHLRCATDVAATRGPVVVTTAGFDLVRPTRRGGPVAFRPNSVLSTIDHGSG